jgi:hypothetical protein
MEPEKIYCENCKWHNAGNYGLSICPDNMCWHPDFVYEYEYDTPIKKVQTISYPRFCSDINSNNDCSLFEQKPPYKTLSMRIKLWFKSQPIWWKILLAVIIIILCTACNSSTIDPYYETVYGTHLKIDYHIVDKQEYAIIHREFCPYSFAATEYNLTIDKVRERYPNARIDLCTTCRP